MMNVKHFLGVFVVSAAALVNAIEQSLETPKDELDRVIEDEITEKLSKDLLQSIEKKFQMDLEKSVDMVLAKIKLLLQNGTTHIQDKMIELRNSLDSIRDMGKHETDRCLSERVNASTALAENALHQMVVCGYALIGHDPSQAIARVLGLKNMIKEGVKPLYGEKKEIYDLLKVCGHDHGTLKKVVRCVISKSTTIKSTIMDMTSKLIHGVVDLSKLLARGAMHEACLIEVVKSTEDEAFKLVEEVKSCTIEKSAQEELIKYIAENNATVLDFSDKNEARSRAEEFDHIQNNSSNHRDNTMNKSTVSRRVLNEGGVKMEKRNQNSDVDKDNFRDGDNKLGP